MKKKPIEKLLKVLILFTSIVSMISCEKNEIEDSANTKMSSENISKNQVLNELNDNKIIEFVSNSKYFTNSNELLKNNQTTSSNSESTIFQKIVKPNEYTTYSLRLNSYTSQKPYFKYFVINKEISGIEKAGFVKYIPSTPTYELDVDNFTGDIEIYNTDDELFAKTTFQNGQPISNNSNKSNNTTFGCYNVSYIVARPCSHGGGHMPGQSCGAGFVNDAYYEIISTVVCIDNTIKSIVPPDTFGGGGGGGGGATILNLLNVPEPYEGEPSFSNQSFMFYQQIYNFLQANTAYNNLVNHQFANNCLVSDWIVPTVVDYFRYNSFDEQQNQINVINAMNMFTNFLQFESNQYNHEEMLVNKFQTFQLLLQNSQWFSSQTNQTRQDIFNYLLENHLNEQSREFIQWSINYLNNNTSVTWHQFKNWFLTPREGQDYIYDSTYWENPSLTFPQQNLPTFQNFDTNYPRMNGEQLAQLVGGDVLNLYNQYPSVVRGFCALKVSRALNYSGVTIPNITTTNGNPGTVLGGDGKYYFLNAKALNKWMQKTFGVSPTNSNHIKILGSQGGENGGNFPTLTAGIKGIYSMVSSNPDWASGHADLINEGICVFGCHFYDNPPAPIDYIDIWILN